MRLAAIDIGTNSVHMIVVRVRADLSFEVIDREKEMVRLGAGGLDGRKLTEAAMAAGLQALSKFRRLADAHEVDEIIATATSATREAENGGDFLAAIAQQTGIRAKIISGAEEARLIHLAATYGIDLEGGKGVVIDIGGGSTEVTLGGPGDAQLARSFKLGVIRLTERYVKSDPLTSREERRLVKHIESTVGAHVNEIRKRGYARVIGTSGTILSLGAMAAAAQGNNAGGDLRNVRVGAKAIRRLRKQLVGLDQRDRLELPGLDPRRADISVAGSVLIDTLLRVLEADEITLCDLALREGLILDYINSHRAQIAKVDRYPDIRRRSVLELGERCNYWSLHTQQVSTLALALFDQTQSIHQLGPKEREWLEYGALLHDIGVHISYQGHHKHSQYLIRHGDLRGFEPHEIDIIGLVARYHRRGEPKKSDDEYAALRGPLRSVVRTLAAFTTLAEGLDRSHAQVVQGLDVIDRGTDMVIRLRCTADAELEQWAAHRHLQPFETLVGKPARIELAQQAADTDAPGNGQDVRPTGRLRGTNSTGAPRGAASRRRVIS
ncbi:MAG: Ppx/GppA phosphatase family protein [Vicinamibacterales bacterium]